MDPGIVLKLIESDPRLLYLLGVPLALIYLYGIWRGINDKKVAPPAAAPLDWSQGTMHLQGPFEKMIAALDRIAGLLRDIREDQKDAAHALHRLNADQAAQTHDHNEHMRAIRSTLERVENRSARWARRNGDHDS